MNLSLVVSNHLKRVQVIIMQWKFAEVLRQSMHSRVHNFIRTSTFRTTAAVRPTSNVQ